MSRPEYQPTAEEIEVFKAQIDKYRYDFERLVYIVFPFGQAGTELEDEAPYDWQLEEWRKLSYHLMNPATRYETYRLIISSGNGAAKTAFGAMTVLMLMYTQRLRCRVTANTQPQMSSVVWPEYDVWFRRARFSEHFFEKFGTSIKARNNKFADTWRTDVFNWSENSPAAISGLHNKGYATCYVFEEAPGIPANIWNYASGAFTEKNTIKIHMAFGNSDDPESKFEQNMTSPLWHAKRIDTRTLDHIDPKQIQDWLTDAGGDEDDDDFRVRVRGLPRKSAKDSIIKKESVNEAIRRVKDFDLESVKFLPCILTCDPAWQGGDETVIWYRQGNYACMLDRFKLKEIGLTHRYTYDKLCGYERELKADAVFIDQGEGTGIYTLAMDDQKTNWELFSFANTPTDAPEFKDSEYSNLRAQMYYESNKWLKTEGVIDARDEDWFDDIRDQLCWTKGTRHKKHGKKLAEPKLDIKDRVGRSPDVADGFVLCFARKVTERKWENDQNSENLMVGQQPLTMPSHDDPYENMNDDFNSIYN